MEFWMAPDKTAAPKTHAPSPSENVINIDFTATKTSVTPAPSTSTAPPSATKAPMSADLREREAEFNMVYQSLLTDGVQYILEDFYVCGMILLHSNLHDRTFAEDLLFKMMVIFPNCAELKYYMGSLSVKHGADVHRAFYWFIQAFHSYRRRKQPPFCKLTPNETVINMMNILMNNHYTDYLTTLFKQYADVFDKFIGTSDRPPDPRLAMAIGNYYIETFQIYKAEQVYHRVMNLDHKDQFVNMESESQSMVLNNVLILNLGIVGQMPKVISVLKDAEHILKKQRDNTAISYDCKVNLFCTFMFIFDYVHYDPAHRLAVNKYVHTFFPKTSYTGSLEPKVQHRIRIGYVSSDLLNHAVSNFIWPILEHHNRHRFDVYIYMNKGYAKLMDNPKYAHRKAMMNDRVFNIEGMSAQDAVSLIQGHQIDILMDLHGYTKLNRLDIFALNPSPIQITYLGYPNTVGSADILQYRITDAVADPVTSRQWYSETLLRMNRCFLLFSSVGQTVPVAHRPTPAWVVLGSLNRESKISDEVYRTWRRILVAAPRTKLFIKLNTVLDSEIHKERFYEKLNLGQDIDKDRIIFAPYGSVEDYFGCLSQIDILLDTFPYSGTTTSCNALYNSVPVVTMRHPDLHAHNVTASLLHHCGLDELIAKDPDEYVKIAVKLCSNSDTYRHRQGDAKTAPCRGKVHEQFQRCMDPMVFMKEYEKVLLQTVIDRHTRKAGTATVPT